MIQKRVSLRQWGCLAVLLNWFDFFSIPTYLLTCLGTDKIRNCMYQGSIFDVKSETHCYIFCTYYPVSSIAGLVFGEELRSP